MRNGWTGQGIPFQTHDKINSFDVFQASKDLGKALDEFIAPIGWCLSVVAPGRQGKPEVVVASIELHLAP